MLNGIAINLLCFDGIYERLFGNSPAKIEIVCNNVIFKKFEYCVNLNDGYELIANLPVCLADEKYHFTAELCGKVNKDIDLGMFIYSGIKACRLKEW